MPARTETQIPQTHAAEQKAGRRAGWTQRPRSRWIALAVSVALIYLAFLPPGIYAIDGNAMLAVAESIVIHHDFSVPEGLGTPGVGGKLYSHWYPLLSVLAVPFVYAAMIVSRLTHLPFHYVAALFSLLLTTLITAVTSGLVALLAERIGASARAAWMAGLAFAFGTVLLAYGREFYAEPLLALLAAAGLYFAFGQSPKAMLLAACCSALAVLAKPSGVVIGPVLVAYLFLRKRSPLSLLPACGTAVGALLYLGYNWLRFGSIFDFGIGGSPFERSTLFAGIPGLLFSPGYGLLWYCPVVFLAALGFREAIRTHLLEALAIVGVLMAFLILHSALPYWFAVWSWGPRYLVPAIPGLCALAALVRPRWQKILVGLTVLGFIISAPTLFCFYERYYSELAAQGVETRANLAWSFRYAPVFHEWPAAIRQVQDARATDVKEIFGQRGKPSRTIESSRALRVVALWWWVLPVAKIPRWIGVLLSFLVFLAGTFTARKGWMLAAREDLRSPEVVSLR